MGKSPAMSPDSDPDRPADTSASEPPSERMEGSSDAPKPSGQDLAEKPEAIGEASLPESGPGPVEPEPETSSDAPPSSEESDGRPGSVPLFAIGPWLWGTLAACLAVQLVLTGLPLLFFYEPTIAGARLSLVELRETSGWGFTRDLHLWASHGLLIAGWLHLLRVFALGSYRRVVGWSATVGLWVVAVLAAWTGSLLPDPGSETPVRAIWVLHSVLLPLVALAIIGLWIRMRRVR